MALGDGPEARLFALRTGRSWPLPLEAQCDGQVSRCQTDGYSSFTDLGGGIWAVLSENELLAFDRRSGAIRWRRPIARHSGDALFADGKLYVATVTSAGVSLSAWDRNGAPAAPIPISNDRAGRVDVEIAPGEREGIIISLSANRICIGI